MSPRRVVVASAAPLVPPRPTLPPWPCSWESSPATTRTSKAGLSYLTNVVKHFKWEPRGRKRIHAKPSALEITACRPWLETEIALVRPEVLVCLGATAAQALLGAQFRVTQRRGEFVDSPLAPRVTATVHPSSILRAPDALERGRAMRLFAQDLRAVAGALDAES